MKQTPTDFLESSEFIKYIHDEYHETLLIYAISLCKKHGVDKSIADDILQEFYEVLIASAVRIQVKYREKGIAYLLTAVKNKLLDFHRKKESYGRMKNVLTENFLRLSKLYYYSTEMLSEDLKKVMVDLLKPQEYQIMELYMEGYAYKEIALKLNLKVNTVGTKIKRCKQKLRTYFSKK
jgi:RNA polymerase sigma factor (sigma-70 family)